MKITKAAAGFAIAAAAAFAPTTLLTAPVASADPSPLGVRADRKHTMLGKLLVAAAVAVAPLSAGVAHADASSPFHEYPECMGFNVNTQEFHDCEMRHVGAVPNAPNPFPQCQGLSAPAAANCGDNILRGR
jgi:hypothetical protein